MYAQKHRAAHAHMHVQVNVNIFNSIKFRVIQGGSGVYNGRYYELRNPCYGVR